MKIRQIAISLYVLFGFVNGRIVTAASACYQLLFAGTTQNADGDDAKYIYAVNADGSSQKPITSGAVYDSFPRWSPDGKYIAFVRATDLSDDENSHLYIMQPDGSGVQRLSPKTLTKEAFPVWSPDSKTLAFLGEQNEKLAIFTIEPDGTGLTQILVLEDSSDNFPSSVSGNLPGPRTLSFSHDGKQLHVVWGSDGTLRTVDLVSKSVKTIPFNGYYPEWSPDDTRIVYVDGKEGSSDIFEMNADGQGIKQLTTSEEEQFPTWSPDGHIIAFTSNRNGNSDFLSDDVYLMAADGSRLTRLTTDMGDYWKPLWSPDGKQLAFWSNITQQIYVIDSDKQRFHSITHLSAGGSSSSDPSFVEQYSWSPLLCH